MKVSSKSPLRYPGGKTRAIPVLDTYITEEGMRVLSPFGGGASWELHLASKGHHVDCYDAFTPLATFWGEILNNREAVVRYVKQYKSAGVDKEVFNDLKKKLTETGHEEAEIAAMFYTVNRCSFSGSTLSGGFSKSASETRFTDRQIEYLERFTPERFSYGLGRWEQILDRSSMYDLVFLDPPYMIDSPKLYGVAGSHHQRFDHYGLADKLQTISTPWILTYNDSEQVRDIYRGFNVSEESWSYGMSKNKTGLELVISNF